NHLKTELDKLGQERNRLEQFTKEHREALDLFKQVEDRIAKSAESLETNVGEQTEILTLTKVVSGVIDKEQIALAKVIGT
ncbi:hypothetical protein ACO1LD_14320, partial [Staphylococcus aureus]